MGFGSEKVALLGELALVTPERKRAFVDAFGDDVRRYPAVVRLAPSFDLATKLMGSMNPGATGFPAQARQLEWVYDVSEGPDRLRAWLEQGQEKHKLVAAHVLAVREPELLVEHLEEYQDADFAMLGELLEALDAIGREENYQRALRDPKFGRIDLSKIDFPNLEADDLNNLELPDPQEKLEELRANRPSEQELVAARSTVATYEAAPLSSSRLAGQAVHPVVQADLARTAGSIVVAHLEVAGQRVR